MKFLFLIFFMTLNVNAALHLSNAAFVEVLKEDPVEVSWDTYNVKDIFHRLQDRKDVSIIGMASKETLKRNAERHEAYILLQNWIAAYQDKNILGIVRLEGARTGVNIILHQSHEKMRVHAIASTDMKNRIFREVLRSFK